MGETARIESPPPRTKICGNNQEKGKQAILNNNESQKPAADASGD